MKDEVKEELFAMRKSLDDRIEKLGRSASPAEKLNFLFDLIGYRGAIAYILFEENPKYYRKLKNINLIESMDKEHKKINELFQPSETKTRKSKH